MKEELVEINAETILTLRRPNGPEVVKLVGLVRKKMEEGMVEEEIISMLINNLHPFVKCESDGKEISFEELLDIDETMPSLVKFAGDIMARVQNMFKKKS